MNILDQNCSRTHVFHSCWARGQEWNRCVRDRSSVQVHKTPPGLSRGAPTSRACPALLGPLVLPLFTDLDLPSGAWRRLVSFMSRVLPLLRRGVGRCGRRRDSDRRRGSLSRLASGLVSGDRGRKRRAPLIPSSPLSRRSASLPHIMAISPSDSECWGAKEHPSGVCTGPAHSCDSRITLVAGLSPCTWALSPPWVPMSSRVRDSRCSINTRIKGSCFLFPPASCFSIYSLNTISGSAQSQDLRFPRC